MQINKKLSLLFSISATLIAISIFTNTTVKAGSFTFNKDLYYGLKNSDVSQLQKLLMSEGCFKVKITGYFGPATREAVKCFQRKYHFTSVPASGYVGSYTRSVLNKINISSQPTQIQQQKSSPPVQTETVSTVPTKEPIYFAINKSYADKLQSGWENTINKLFNDINSIYSKNTSKSFYVSKYLVFEDNKYWDIYSHPDNYPEFYHTFSNIGGITLFYIATPDSLNRNGNEYANWFGTPVGYSIGAVLLTAQGGKISYPAPVIEHTESNNLFTSETNYKLALGFITHELGHTMGVAVPDWYLYKYSDCTGVDPKFTDYNIAADPLFANDPMANEGINTNIGTTRFNALNSNIINRNLDRRYTYDFIQKNWYSKISKIHVLDSTGNPVSGATIKVFPVRDSKAFSPNRCNGVEFGGGVFVNPSPEQTLTTNAQGYATFNGPIGLLGTDSPMVKVLKIYVGAKSAVTIVRFIDLQENYMTTNSNEHVVNVVIK